MEFEDIEVNGFYMTSKGLVKVKAKESIKGYDRLNRWCNCELSEGGQQMKVYPSQFQYEPQKSEW